MNLEEAFIRILKNGLLSLNKHQIKKIHQIDDKATSLSNIFSLSSSQQRNIMVYITIFILGETSSFFFLTTDTLSIKQYLQWPFRPLPRAKCSTKTMLKTTKLWAIQRLSQKSWSLGCSIFNQPCWVSILLSIWYYNMALFWPPMLPLSTHQQWGWKQKDRTVQLGKAQFSQFFRVSLYREKYVRLRGRHSNSQF